MSFAQLHSLQSQLEFQEQSMVEKSLVSRQEAKIRELETKLEYERTQIKRLEVRQSQYLFNVKEHPLENIQIRPDIFILYVSRGET